MEDWQDMDWQCQSSIVQKQLARGILQKAVIKNFAKFTGKYLCQSLFLIKLQAEPSNFIKKRDSGTVVFL